MEILGGTGRNGIFLGKIFGGTGRLFLFFLAGRDGCCFFPRRDGAVFFFFRGGTRRLFFFPKRDGAVVFFFRGGTGRLFFFSEAGRDGVVVFFQRRDLAVVFFVRVGTGVFFSAGTGRLTVVVFSAGTVLPTGNDEDGTRELQILAPCL